MVYTELTYRITLILSLMACENQLRDWYDCCSIVGGADAMTTKMKRGFVFGEGIMVFSLAQKAIAAALAATTLHRQAKRDCCIETSIHDDEENGV